MDIGNQIKALRLRRGVTQEAVAQHFGITAQAVSKWECGSSVPDIGMLPGLSAYFGVSIDELFALSDEIRMERIQNMLWDVRFLNPADAENERNFPLDMGRREPKNADPYCMLAQMELHLAKEHCIRAQEYALEILERENGVAMGCYYLGKAMGGVHVDPRHNSHNALVAYYKACLEKYPDKRMTYGHLISQLIDDHRLAEAQRYCDEMEAAYPGDHFTAVHKIKVAIAKGDLNSARVMLQELDGKYPDDWSIQHWIGDLLTLAGEYSTAKVHYKRSIELLPMPRYADPIDSLAKCCEMDGDIEGAIATRKFELEISETEWGDTTGETVDAIHREIARLESLLKQQA